MFAPHTMETTETATLGSSTAAAAADSANGTGPDSSSTSSSSSSSRIPTGATHTNTTLSPSPSPRTATPPLSVLKSSSKRHQTKTKTTPVDSSNPKPDIKPNHAPKKVSFADKLEDTCILEDVLDDCDNETPWYVEHKEALLLLVLGGLASLSFFIMRKK